MIDFIGDLSKQDAQVLKELAEKHERIIEFGSGGSTQILGHYTKGKVISYETNEYWIRKTKNILLSMNIENVQFQPFKSVNDISVPEHDLLFVDGYREIRVQFSMAAIDSNKAVIAFHDTRVRKYTEPLMPFVHLFWNRIKRIDVNYLDSNITVIQLRNEPLVYEDWNKVEGRTREQIGIA